MKKIFYLIFIIFFVSCSISNKNIKEKTNSGKIKIIDFGEIQDDKYCLLNECIPETIMTTLSGTTIIGKGKIKNSNGKEYDIEYKFNKKNQEFKKNEKTLDGYKNIELFRLNDIFVKKILEKNRNGDYFEQEIFNLKGEKIKNYDLGLKNLKIGKDLYKPKFNYNSFFNYGNYDTETELSKNIIKIIQKNCEGYPPKQIPKDFFVELKDYPGLKIFYKSDSYDGTIITSVNLGTEKNYLEKYIKTNDIYMDLEITNKIINKYNKDIFPSFPNFWNKNGLINKVKKSDLPIFQAIKADEYGNYIFYLINENIKFKPHDFCIYDKENLKCGIPDF